MNRIAHLTRKAQYNKHACEELFAFLLPKIYAFVASRVPTTEIAEDLTNDIFVKITRNLPDATVRSNKQTMAWFFTIARNRITDFYRTQKQVDGDEALAAVHTNAHTAIQIGIDHSLAMTDIRVAMTTLSPIQQECISLRFFSDLSNTEIAVTLKLKPKTVSSHISRGLANLRTAMGPDYTL